MTTIDDSGSMLSDAMPEGTFSVNGKSVSLLSKWVAGFPGDPRKGTTYGDCYAPADPASTSTYQRWYRSPDINTIWYNPEVRYRPWLKPKPAPDGSGVRMSNVADPKKAPWDPVTTGLSPATFDLVTKRSINTTWCTGSSATSSGSKNFSPGIYYRLKTPTSAPDVAGNFVLYDVNGVDGPYSPDLKSADRTDCAGTKCTQAEEIQNFANWFTYYRMRESMAKAAVTESFFNFKDKLRAGWGRINKTTATKVDGTAATKSFSIVELGVKQLDATQLETMLTGVQGIQSWPSTPLRTALDGVGQYFYKRTDSYSPWMTTPGDTSAPGNVKLACRRTVNVLTTDGYYNDSYTAASDQDTTASSFSYPYDEAHPDQNPGNYSPYTYTPGRPFTDAPGKYSNTLADAAMRWYVEDLDPSIANKVAPIDGDIAFWQHLTQFTVGIGVKGTLDASTDAAKASTLAALTQGTATWPDPSQGNPQKIDDLWHAAVNTGGDFNSVKNVTELTQALSAAFGKAVDNTASESGAGTVASTLALQNIKFVPEYKSGAWYGDVLAYKLDTSGNVIGTSPVWKASSTLPAFTDRKLFTWSGSKPEAFTIKGVDAAGKTLISATETDAENLISYIRGDASNEGAASSYRSRGGQFLGDFINSPPVFVKNLVNLGYDQLSNGTWKGAYADYLATKSSRTDGVVAVGANAGVFHLFQGSTGKEVFGFLPREGFSHYAALASKTYGSNDNYHRFFVDGPTVESDVYIQPRGETGARWTNVLIGSMGAGGRDVFALHLPTADPSADLGASNVLWELSGHADLGYVIGDIRVGAIQGATLADHSGWYAFVGNGAYSSSGNAALLVVDVQSGAVVKSIQVPTSGANGLGGVYLLRNAHQEVYAAYAGDLQGNLWRFDFGDGANTDSWKVSFGGQPLFKALDSAGVAQPITASPMVIAHPSQGYVVLFGTGKLFDESDPTNMALQSFYGAWDNTAAGSPGGNASPFYAAVQAGGVSPYRSVLVQQTINTTDVVTGTKVVNGQTVTTNERFYKVSSNSIDWTTKKGWYLDLNIMGGQRVVYPSQGVLTFAYINTIVPAQPAAQCEYNVGTGFNFVIDAYSGAAPTTPVFDTNGDGVVNSSDAIVAGAQSLADGVDKLLTSQPDVVGDQPPVAQCLEDKEGRCPVGYCLTVAVNSSGEGQEMCLPDKCTINPAACPPAASHVITDRVWRQILNPPTPAAAP
ncbi:pilus assembly protein [Ideonella oryzae]|nr:PilC/PilY family type IV pilus protein [Ideonella oryzae]